MTHRAYYRLLRFTRNSLKKHPFLRQWALGPIVFIRTEARKGAYFCAYAEPMALWHSEEKG